MSVLIFCNFVNLSRTIFWNSTIFVAKPQEISNSSLRVFWSFQPKLLKFQKTFITIVCYDMFWCCTFIQFSESILNGLRVSSPGPCAPDACQNRFSWFFYWIQKVQKFVNLVDIVKSFQTIFFSNKIAIQTSIEYLLANIGVDTAENGPLKVCQQLAKS